MPNVGNTNIGVASLTYNGVDLGYTLGGMNYDYDPSFTEIKVDDYGDTPIDLALKGEKFSVTAHLAEDTFNVLQAAIASGDHLSGVNGDRLEIGSKAGGLMGATKAFQLVIHPKRYGNTDYSHDITLYRAISMAKLTGDFTFDKQKVYQVTFQAIIDETKAIGDRLGHIGVPSVS